MDPAPKRGRGRPALPPEERRVDTIDVRVTPAEREMIVRGRDLAGATDTSAYLRDLAARELRRLERKAKAT